MHSRKAGLVLASKGLDQAWLREWWIYDRLFFWTRWQTSGSERRALQECVARSRWENLDMACGFTAGQGHLGTSK